MKRPKQVRLGEGCVIYYDTYGRVNFVDTETRVQVCKWRDRWPDPRSRKCRFGADICCVVGIVNLRVSYERNKDACMRAWQTES